MKILLDECAPEGLRSLLSEHKVATVRWKGWRTYKNGQLLNLAQSEFDVLITLDSNLEQQNKVANFKIGVIVLRMRLTNPDTVEAILPELRLALARIQPGKVIALKDSNS